MQIPLFQECPVCHLTFSMDHFVRRTRVKNKPTKNCQTCRDRSLAADRANPRYGKRQREYAANNREKSRLACREWRRSRDTAGIGYYTARAAVDLAFKETRRISSITNGALRCKKRSRRGEEVLGCTIAEFRVHLEGLFQPGMTWENYGGRDGWSIDHRFPLSVAAKHSPEALAKAANYRNVQPLWFAENKRKHTNLPQDIPSVEALLLAW